MLVTDVARDGAMAGPNLALHGGIARRWPGLALQASGGVAILDDLRALKQTGRPPRSWGGRCTRERLRWRRRWRVERRPLPFSLGLSKLSAFLGGRGGAEVDALDRIGVNRSGWRGGRHASPPHHPVPRRQGRLGRQGRALPGPRADGIGGGDGGRLRAQPARTSWCSTISRPARRDARSIMRG